MSDTPTEQDPPADTAVESVEPVEPVESTDGAAPVESVGSDVVDAPMVSTTTAAAAPPVPARLVDRLILSGAVGAVVASAAVLRDVAPWAVVVAVLVSVGAFWLIDRLIESRWTPGGATAAAGDAAHQARDAVASNPDLPPVLDAGRVRDDSVDGTDLATGRTHIYTLRLAPHGEPAAGIAPAARIDARTASLAVAAPVGHDDAGGATDASAAARWCERLVRAYTDGAPKPLSISSFDGWLADARGDLDGSDVPPAALAGASIVTDRGSRVAVVMVVGDASAFVVSDGDDGPVARPVVRSTASGSSSDGRGLTTSDRVGDSSATAVWATVPVRAGDRLVVASATIADWMADASTTDADRRLDLLARPTVDEIGVGLSDERIAGRLADGAGAVAVVSLAP